MNIENCTYQSIIAAIDAGKKIMEIYNAPDADFELEKKSDNSPVTIADKKAHNIIKKHLEIIKIPLLSEEGKNIDYKNRKYWDYYFLVDPLDGTKEFLKKNGEFTVNIALIHKNRPVAGVVYLPALKTLYFAFKNSSYKIIEVSENTGTKKNLNDFINISENLHSDKKPDEYTIIATRSHQNEELKNFIKEKEKIYGNLVLISAGSSLKFCKMAEGLAHVYPRTGKTMEWDTAAGHAVCEGAGLEVKNLLTGENLIYNKKDLSNPYFIVA